ncbi:type II toxin-antitoxin system RelE/ParE family toxin [Actinomyces bowdenii]|uniref:Type II toxin-antitoxin system RelE/ParE family toxin n=1 Tax=Actinomyces bowdenii TaxID=131109 RepID=A0A853EI38_9ACTO|nr:type II toxin-antitoxin system RelE/ParE family toxin [Actinomyces bowdenii]MBF0696870.1 type II toxin-antitoxin system RelE/ParE family toxin [Actinomyces bowdenii]MCR2051834.1 type II toxin-antitoxin system RelE/ParE family toxin [Actinomyces bowdenii]MDO5065451.1 type II toxin-antitoxin system RelE/ParE family toxin [Actinomyces bowdenii]NYS69043.1 type II toxin-antitoxin system RelE/ParE family toxin [Actinomyces bowdenii]
MNPDVVFSPWALRHMTGLYRRIAEESGSSDLAEAYLSAIMDRCEALAEFPLTGRLRDDIRPHLRTVGFRNRVVIAFAVCDNRIEVLGVHYGGRDHDGLQRGEAPTVHVD